MVEPGEEPLAAAIREVREETLIDDLRVRLGRDLHPDRALQPRQGRALLPRAHRHRRVTLTVIEELGRAEHNEFRWVDYETALKLVSPRVAADRRVGHQPLDPQRRRALRIGTEERVVIVGAGFAGLNAAKRLRNVRRTSRSRVLDRENHHLFQPLLYQVAMAALSPGGHRRADPQPAVARTATSAC